MQAVSVPGSYVSRWCMLLCDRCDPSAWNTLIPNGEFPRHVLLPAHRSPAPRESKVINGFAFRAIGSTSVTCFFCKYALQIVSVGTRMCTTSAYFMYETLTWLLKKSIHSLYVISKANVNPSMMKPAHAIRSTRCLLCKTLDSPWMVIFSPYCRRLIVLFLLLQSIRFLRRDVAGVSSVEEKAYTLNSWMVFLTLVNKMLLHCFYQIIKSHMRPDTLLNCQMVPDSLSCWLNWDSIGYVWFFLYAVKNTEWVHAVDSRY